MHSAVAGARVRASSASKARAEAENLCYPDPQISNPPRSSTAVLQNCNIYARNPPNEINTITAQARTNSNQNTEIVIHNSQVAAASDLKLIQSSVKTYLGRPWQKYSRTVFMKTVLGSSIAPVGWLEWDGNFALDTLYYAEYANTGRGSSTANKINWKGYHVLTSATDGSKFTVANFIVGNP
ncbi:hypothetical protein SLEP1_g35463 [Rubroshorea leprosula]|uniref:Pectinesterase catalytic domain-containing protein n=1 Tax=Rubroshorea leprosula TaxID=152421 RepID=A0AAV5KNA4_9ROSI|nr:hypothetical protein SLEP1_g35463 [Rubroshorea leprosula]